MGRAPTFARFDFGMVLLFATYLLLAMSLL